MNALALALLASVVGVDYGWQINRAGELEYIVQIEPQLVAALRDGETLESEIPPNMRNIRRIIVRVGSGALPHDALPAEHHATPAAATSPPLGHTGAQNSAQPATLHQPATAWTPATAPRVVAQASPPKVEAPPLSSGFANRHEYNTSQPLTASETAAGQIGSALGGGAFQPAGTAPAAGHSHASTPAGGGFTPGGFNPGSAPALSNPALASPAFTNPARTNPGRTNPAVHNPSTAPPLAGSTPISSAPPLTRTNPQPSPWAGTNPATGYNPQPGANPAAGPLYSPAPTTADPPLYTPREQPVVAAPAPPAIQPIRDTAPPRVSVPLANPALVASPTVAANPALTPALTNPALAANPRSALNPGYTPGYTAGGALSGPRLVTRPPAAYSNPAGSPVSIPAGASTAGTSTTGASTTGAVGSATIPAAATLPAGVSARDKLTELTGEKPWWMLTLIAILLFVSIGMNCYLWWVARGIYNRYRRLTAEIRDGAALL